MMYFDIFSSDSPCTFLISARTFTSISSIIIISIFTIIIFIIFISIDARVADCSSQQVEYMNDNPTQIKLWDTAVFEFQEGR